MTKKKFIWKIVFLGKLILDVILSLEIRKLNLNNDLLDLKQLRIKEVRVLLWVTLTVFINPYKFVDILGYWFLKKNQKCWHWINGRRILVILD